MCPQVDVVVLLIISSETDEQMHTHSVCFFPLDCLQWWWPSKKEKKKKKLLLYFSSREAVLRVDQVPSFAADPVVDD